MLHVTILIELEATSSCILRRSCADYLLMHFEAFFRGLAGSDLSVLRALRLKIFFVEKKKCFFTEEVVGIVSEIDTAVRTCSCFLKRYSLTRAASFFLNNLYFFGSKSFLFSLSVILFSFFLFFCGIAGLIQITLLSPIASTVIFCLFFCSLFSITSCQYFT